MTMYQNFIAALQAFNGEYDIQYDEPMARHTTMRIGGPADVFLVPRTIDALGAAKRAARDCGVPCAVIGNGSNLLVSDAGYRGAVLCTSGLRAVTVEGNQITAQAGALLSVIARAAADAGLTGLEFAAGIPGSLGGAVFMNAGAYDGQMADRVTSVTYLDGDGVAHTLAAHELAFGYRESVFKTHEDWTVVCATMALTPGDATAIHTKMEDFACRRRDKQPLEMPSAGSTFKRPQGDFAGRLIEQAGMKGFAVGGAQVSEKHAGFVVNRGGATCADMLALIHTVQERVRAQSGVSLECEVRVL